MDSESRFGSQVADSYLEEGHSCWSSALLPFEGATMVLEQTKMGNEKSANAVSQQTSVEPNEKRSRWTAKAQL